MQKNKKKVSLDDEIYSMIKRAITNRELAPGTKLSEEELANMLNVSRTPIRLALKRLSYEMLVTIIPRRGAFVAQPTPQEVKNVFEMRMLLEDYSVRKACEKSKESKGFFERIESCIELEKAAYSQGDIPGVLLQVEDIHVEIAKISGNNILVNQLRDLIALTNIYLTFFGSMSSNNPRSPKEHFNILMEIKNGHSEKASLLMYNHIFSILNRLDFNLIQQTHGGIESVFKKTNDVKAN
ncbi:GntR family transcriptional regulator [Bacillus aerolatus]|uniref:GntR family transcriptional regulator n=1 Tax=Bacillus aerolatus TaxID=2653354 RepID=A0A6I1FEU8_9BACI|nr:GntR family transcriptional regulator [Bacillus aerolatus]KAB7706527.1 GntR family transcriptional regulator [Bacillus aerolatus]